MPTHHPRRARPEVAPSLSAAVIDMRGVRVYSWGQFENKAFGGVGYEIKKKLIWHYTNLSSAWASLWPPVHAMIPPPHTHTS